GVDQAGKARKGTEFHGFRAFLSTKAGSESRLLLNKVQMYLSVRDCLASSTLGVLHRRCRWDGLNPLNRSKLAYQRMLQNLANTVDRNDLQAALHVLRNVRQVLGVLLRNEHRLDAAAQSREKLFLQAADRQDAAPKRDLTRHGDVLADRNAGHDRHDGGHHSDTSGRTILRRGPFRDVDVDV